MIIIDDYLYCAIFMEIGNEFFRKLVAAYLDALCSVFDTL